MSVSKWFFILLMISSYKLSNGYATALQKIFHHQKVTHAKELLTDLELGRLILYFNNEPIVKQTQVTQETNGYKNISYFFPTNASMSNEVKEMIAAIEKKPSPFYKITIEYFSKPQPGLELRIGYNSKQIEIQYDYFDAITKAKGVEFRFYNKLLLTNIKNKNQTLLRSAFSSPTVILDCGHGGKDFGAIGLIGTVEKEITLSIGKQVAQLLAQNNIPVVLTRQKDQFVSLEKRTYIANKNQNNSIFISLHANSAANKEVHGLETFYTDNVLFKKKNQLETAIDVMIQNYDAWQNSQSKKLAYTIHKALLDTLQKNNISLPDRNLKSAATQVLMGIKWPGTLIELDFITNIKGASNLINNRTLISEGIFTGIMEFIKQIH